MYSEFRWPCTTRFAAAVCTRTVHFTLLLSPLLFLFVAPAHRFSAPCVIDFVVRAVVVVAHYSLLLWALWDSHSFFAYENNSCSNVVLRAYDKDRECAFVFVDKRVCLCSCV